MSIFNVDPTTPPDVDSTTPPDVDSTTPPDVDSTTPPGTTVLPLQSTPIKVEVSTVLPFTTTQKYRVESVTVLAREMKKYMVGPMPVQLFLDEFLPTSERRSPRRHIGVYSETAGADMERRSYDPFITTSRQYAPNFKFVNSSAYPDSNPRLRFPFQIKPDVSIYPANTDDNVKTDSSLAEMFIEFKWNSIDDPFFNFSELDPNRRHVVRDTKTGEDTLGQITSYAAAQLGAQFRTHVFSVLIIKEHARLLRWDRSGAIVTESFRYNTCSNLPEFFMRYSKATDAMRGKDTSVSKPSLEEKRAAIRALRLKRTTPLVKLSIPDAGDDRPDRQYVTYTPEALPYTPPGRATRGFKAYGIVEKAVVFLKDSWRINLLDIEQEGRVYDTLSRANVVHVPHCLASGDISTDKYHATKTDKYCGEQWAACHDKERFIPHRHYRLSLDIFGRGLMEFQNSHEMVSALRDALIALKGSYDAGILHRDFSPGNVIIDEEGKGWLIDWDLSKPVTPSNNSETPRCATRTGTWQFMSANLVVNPHAQHSFKDDLESSLYVLLWVIVMYSTTSDGDAVPHFMANVLDPKPYHSKGGFGKHDLLSGKSFLKNVTFPGREALHKLVWDLTDLFQFRYERKPTAEERQEYEAMRAALVNDDPKLLAVVERTNYCAVYDRGVLKLEGHAATIELFDTALRIRSNWPDMDAAQKQVFEADEATIQQPNERVLKTEYRQLG